MKSFINGFDAKICYQNELISIGSLITDEQGITYIIAMTPSLYDGIVKESLNDPCIKIQEYDHLDNMRWVSFNDIGHWSYEPNK